MDYMGPFLTSIFQASDYDTNELRCVVGEFYDYDSAWLPNLVGLASDQSFLIRVGHCPARAKL